ncbi:MAG: hypothetical protein NTY79_05560 [Chloroflexi bacterium]|nr:hypothetical protein [Chloroflexota bacterium]
MVKSRKKPARRGFYLPALDDVDGLQLEEARGVEGLDEEIAVLRLKLRELLQEQPGEVALHLRAATVLANLVKVRYAVSKEGKKGLKEAITRVLIELAVPLGVKALIK